MAEMIKWNDIGDTARAQARAYFRELTGRDPNDSEMTDIVAKASGSGGMQSIRDAISQAPQVMQLKSQQQQQQILQQQNQYYQSVIDSAKNRESAMNTLAGTYGQQGQGLMNQFQSFLGPVDMNNLDAKNQMQLNFLKQTIGQQNQQGMADLISQMQRRGVTGSSIESSGMALQNQRGTQAMSGGIIDFLNQLQMQRSQQAQLALGGAGLAQSGQFQALGNSGQAQGLAASGLMGQAGNYNPFLGQQLSNESFYNAQPIIEAQARLQRQAQQQSLFSKILQGVGTAASIVTAPLTGGASLAGLAAGGIGGLFGGGGGGNSTYFNQNPNLNLYNSNSQYAQQPPQNMNMGH